jgi:hypothetical protein
MTNKTLFLCCVLFVVPALAHSMARKARPGDVIKGSDRETITISDAELNAIIPATNPTYPTEFPKLISTAAANGILLKGDSDAVYLVRSGFKQHVMDPGSLAGLKQHGMGNGYAPAYRRMAGPDFLQVSDEEMRRVPSSLSASICDRVDGSVIKGSGPTQYGVEAGGALRAIPDPETLNALFPGKQYEQVTDACITHFSKKGPVYRSVR